MLPSPIKDQGVSSWETYTFILSLGSSYWVGQKVHLDFSVPSYGKIRTNFLANPILLLLLPL